MNLISEVSWGELFCCLRPKSIFTLIHPDSKTKSLMEGNVRKRMYICRCNWVTMLHRRRKKNCIGEITIKKIIII